MIPNSEYRTRGVLRANDALPPGIGEGLRDAQAGRPYHPDYDRWDGRRQRNYENARCKVAHARALGVQLPRVGARTERASAVLVAALRRVTAADGSVVLKSGRYLPAADLPPTRVLDRRGLPLPVRTFVEEARS